VVAGPRVSSAPAYPGDLRLRPALTVLDRYSVRRHPWTVLLVMVRAPRTRGLVICLVRQDDIGVWRYNGGARLGSPSSIFPASLRFLLPITALIGSLLVLDSWRGGVNSRGPGNGCVEHPLSGIAGAAA